MSTTSPAPSPSARYAWTVFALTVALMLSDFMTRSVMSGVLPDVKAAWGLSDAQLGLLVSIVPLMVGIGAWPIALLSDRVGYVRSVTMMGAVWCVGTVLCGLSQTQTQMLMARAAVGLGEAAYGPAGAALLSGLFPMGRLAAVLGAFQAAAVFGTALGVVAGSAIGARHGWEAAFIWIGGGSLLLVILFPLLVREPAHAAAAAAREPAIPVRTVLRALFSPRSARYIYLASGLQMLVLAIIGAWTPTFIAREYGLATDAAGARAGLVIIMVGIGMIVGGVVADRAARSDGERKLRVAAAYTLASFALLSTAFATGPGPMQMAALVLGTLVSGAHAGIVAATVVDVTDPRLRATAVATVSLFNNLLGLAPGPYLVGVLSDATGLKPALSIVMFSGLAAAVLFVLAARHYERETVARRSRPAGVNAADGVV